MTAKRAITDDLLSIVIDSKLEAGVSSAEIQTLISEFSFTKNQRAQSVGETICHAEVSAIPQHRKGEFVERLVSLLPRPDYAAEAARRQLPQSRTARRTFSAKAILGMAIGLFWPARAAAA